MADIVCKFGGTSLACSDNILKVRDIVKNNNKRFVIVSAPGKRNKDDIKITDTLIKCFNLSKSGQDFSEYFSLLVNRYEGIKKELNVLDLDLSKYYEQLKSSILEHNDYDFVVSRGEFFSALIISKFFNYEFLDAASFITFNKSGKVDLVVSKQKFDELTKDGFNYVIPGFYGLDFSGKIKTFSRGGSDVSGAIVAVLSNASVYENWTDVNGFLVADPRLCENPAVIDELNYQELRELSYMGANVLHPDCVRFLRQNNIVLNLRNTFNPTCKGSLIMPDSKKINHKKITGIAGQKGFMIFHIEKFDINESLGIIEIVAKVFKKYNIPIDHIPTGIDTISVIVQKSFITNELKTDIVEEIKKSINPDKLNIIENVSLISVVGTKLIEDIELEQEVFKSIYSSNSKIITLNKGAGGISIIFAVPEDNFENTIKHMFNSLF